MKTLLLMLLIFCTALTVKAQELFLDALSQDTGLFLGGFSPENGKALKVFVDGEIRYQNAEDLTQVGLLVGNEFIDELFRQGLCFELSGYEPYWEVSIFKNILTVMAPEYDSLKQYKVNLSVGKDLGSVFYATFSTECGTIFGAINNIGLNFNGECRICEYNLEAPSLYEAYVNIEGNSYKGCGNIRPINGEEFVSDLSGALLCELPIDPKADYQPAKAEKDLGLD